MQFLARLSLILVVLLMPLGMAPAQAVAPSHHAAAMPMPHCPDQQHKPAKGGITECTMACAAALPAIGTASSKPFRIVCVPERPAAAQRLDGLHPDTATPPPRRS